jgi:hypothetical protein
MLSMHGLSVLLLHSGSSSVVRAGMLRYLRIHADSGVHLQC